MMVEFFKNLFKCDYLFNKIRLNEYLEKVLKIITMHINEISNEKIEDVCEKDSYFNDNKFQGLFDKILKTGILKKNEPIEVYNKIQSVNNEDKYFDIFEGLILKLKFIQKLPNEVEIRNIMIFKSDSMITHKNLFDSVTFLNDENEIIIEFIEHILIKNNVNTIYLIGCELDIMIKEILDSYNISYYEWLNWKNYQVK